MSDITVPIKLDLFSDCNRRRGKMKIVVINGQNHKGSMYHIGNELVKKLNSEVTEFILPKDFGEFCVGYTT